MKSEVKKRVHSCSNCQNKEFTKSGWKKHVRLELQRLRRRHGIKPTPQKVLCFKCQKEFEWGSYFTTYLKRNKWDYWTENKEDEGKYICDTCLVVLRQFQKPEFLSSVKNESKRKILRIYSSRNKLEVIHTGIFDCDEENCGQKFTLWHVMSKTGEEFLCES